MSNIDEQSTDTGLPPDFMSGENEEETAPEQQEASEDAKSDIEDETANLVFNQPAPSVQSNQGNNQQSKSIEKKLEEATSQRSYYSVCKEIEKKTQQQYNDQVSKHFLFLLENQKMIQGEYGTQDDQPNGEWMINPDDADEETLTKEIKRIRAKISNINRENKTLQAKKTNLDNRLNDAYTENDKLQKKLDK